MVGLLKTFDKGIKSTSLDLYLLSEREKLKCLKWPLVLCDKCAAAVCQRPSHHC